MIAQSSEITINNDNGTLTVSSLQVAEDFEKEHRSILRTIDDLKSEVDPAQNLSLIHI